MVTVLSRLSLLLCAAAAVAWPVSYLDEGTLFAYRRSGQDVRGAFAEVGRGGLGVTAVSVTYVGTPSVPEGCGRQWFGGGGHPTYPVGLTFRGRIPVRLGFGVSVETVDLRSKAAGVSGAHACLIAPLWAWALAFGLLPGWRAWRRHRRRRGANGQAFEVVRRGA